jgi:Ca2+:H+ antiporter
MVTVSTPGPDFTKSQLAFAGIASFALYGAFIFFQTVSHRDYYLPNAKDKRANSEVHADEPSNLKTTVSVFLLLLSLAVVVGLAEALNPAIEAGVKAAGAPKTVVGIAIAMLVLLPEGRSGPIPLNSFPRFISGFSTLLKPPLMRAAGF